MWVKVPKTWCLKIIFVSLFSQLELQLAQVTLIGKGWDSLAQRESAMVLWGIARTLASKGGQRMSGFSVTMHPAGCGTHSVGLWCFCLRSFVSSKQGCHIPYRGNHPPELQGNVQNNKSRSEPIDALLCHNGRHHCEGEIHLHNKTPFQEARSTILSILIFP